MNNQRARKFEISPNLTAYLWKTLEEGALKFSDSPKSKYGMTKNGMWGPKTFQSISDKK